MSFRSRLEQRSSARASMDGVEESTSLIEVPSMFVIVDCPFNMAELATLPETQALTDALDASDQNIVAALRDLREELV